MKPWILIPMSCRRVLTAGAVCTVLACAPSMAAAQDPAPPSLADLARQEQQRRKEVKAGKVFTDKGAKSADGAAPAASKPARPAGEAAQAGAAAPTPEATDDQKEQTGGKGEAWWKSRITQAREDVRRNEMFAEALQTRVNSLAGDFVARDDPFQRAKIGEDRQKALAELTRVQADIEKGKKQITEIEEEARTAGAPPGWLR
jgi:hypothetical protein